MDYSGFQLDKNTPLPMYYQIEQYLFDSIKNGRITVGECLPPETELMKLYGVSRSTVRQAINGLVIKDILYRSKGKGTFVKAPKIKELSFQVLDSFRDEMQKRGHVPKTRVLALKVVDGIEPVNASLQLDASEKLIYLQRLRFVDDEPVLYFETYLPYQKFPSLIDEDMETESLYQLLEGKYQSRVNRVIRHIEVSNATREEAGYLNIKKNDAIFLVRFTGFCQDTIPVEYSITRYRGDNNEFVVELRR